MDENRVIQERIRFGDDDRLSGVLAYPVDREPARAVLLCSPHPNFAGDMENNIIAALAERLANDAITLRFDYRGIGQSRIELPLGSSTYDYWDNIEQTLDYTDPLQDAAEAADELARICGHLPMIAVGYSFGAVTGTQMAAHDPRFIAMVGIGAPFKRIAFAHLADCPKPCLMISGTADFVYMPDVAARLSASAGIKLLMDRVEGADHFFRQQEDLLEDRIRRFCQPIKSPAQLPVHSGWEG